MAENTQSPEEILTLANAAIKTALRAFITIPTRPAREALTKAIDAYQAAWFKVNSPA